MSRENAAGWMARRERGACRERPVTSEQRRQTAYSLLALRVAPLFRLSGRCSSVIPQLRDGYAPSSRLGEAKNRQQRGMTKFFNRLLNGKRVGNEGCLLALVAG